MLEGKDSQFLELEELYKGLITKVSHNNTILNEEQIGELLRPLQDTVKIKYYITQNGIDSFKTIQVILNPDKKHTEYNIFTEVGNNSKEDYIGVSKLCCGIATTN